MLRAALKLVGMLIFSLLLVVFAFLLGFGSSRMVFASKPNSINDGAPAELQKEMPIFWQAWNIINQDFYTQPVDPTKATYGAIDGMVNSLGDPHTVFLDAEHAQFFAQELGGSFEGIGAEVEMRDGRLMIVSPIKGTPAEKAGLKAGDVILEVGDTVIQNMNVFEAINLIRGPKGSSVTLTVQRGSQPSFTVSLTRDTIVTSAVESRMLDGNIAYLKLNEFTATAPQDLHDQLQQLMAQKPKALVFDLRNNPGGLLDVAVKVASEFLKEGNVVLVEKFKNGDKTDYKANAGGLAPDIPMVLLVNEGSASASEIVSGAMKDYKRATIVGTTTYGKGSVQIPHQLSDQSQLDVTIAHFFSPQEHEINGVGIKPDIEVADPTDVQITHSQDPQLDRAVQFINGGARIEWGELILPLFVPRGLELPF
jgi:carboxyl-terminal processing protease